MSMLIRNMSKLVSPTTMKLERNLHAYDTLLITPTKIKLQ